MQLYQIAEDILAAEEALENAQEGSNEQQVLIEFLDQLAADLPQKVEGCVKWEKNLNAYIEALDAEIKTLQAKKKAAENQKKSIRGYVMSALGRLGLQKLKLAIATVSIRAGSQSIEVDESQVESWPLEVFEKAVKVEYRVSKTALREIEGFEALPGVAIAQGPDTLMIR